MIMQYDELQKQLMQVKNFKRLKGFYRHIVPLNVLLFCLSFCNWNLGNI